MEERHEDLFRVKKVPYKKDDMRILENLMKFYLKKPRESAIRKMYSVGGFGESGFDNGRNQSVSAETRLRFWNQTSLQVKSLVAMSAEIISETEPSNDG